MRFTLNFKSSYLTLSIFSCIVIAALKFEILEK